MTIIDRIDMGCRVVVEMTTYNDDNAIKNDKKRDLLGLVSKHSIPRHVGVIPDGNRRFARKNGLSLYEAYELGIRKGEDFAQWCRDLGIKYLSFYTLSIENLERRSERELSLLFSLLKRHMKRLVVDERIHRDKVKIKIVGRLTLLPKDVREVIQEVEEATKDYENYYLIFLIAYSGRAEIIDAIKNIVNEVGVSANDVNEDFLRKRMYLSDIPDPDLVIRTSGEMRISNFLLWYIAYSELYFVRKYWPEVTYEDLLQAIRHYQVRERRFGR